MAKIHKILLNILETQDFVGLGAFKEPAIWNQFGDEERDLFARLLVMEGSQLLALGSSQVFECFSIAREVSLNSVEILCQQAAVFSSYSDNIRCLSFANEALALALKENPAFFEAWVDRAQVLTDIGIFEGESSYLNEAHDHFKKAESLLSFERQPEFYWRWGNSLVSMGDLSGEPLDYLRATEKYKQAEELGCSDPQFLQDYGNCFAVLAYLLENQDYFLKAYSFFEKAVEGDKESAEKWFDYIACALNILQFSSSMEQVIKTNEILVQAAPFHVTNEEFWFKWGQFDLFVAKSKDDIERAQASLEKFAKAYELDAGNVGILNCWADALLFIGIHEEKIDLIQSAKLKLINSIEIDSDQWEAWYLLGLCLNELGQYFQDKKFYNEAIEKFERSLLLSRESPLVWYGMALSYLALGEITQQAYFYESSIYNFGQMIENGGKGFGQFWNDWGLALVKLADLLWDSSYLEQAIEKLENCVKFPSENGKDEEGDLEWNYNYGNALDLLGLIKEEPYYFEKAIQIFHQILQFDPAFVAVRYNLAVSLYHLAEALSDVDIYHKSIDHFHLLLRSNPENEAIHIDFGITLINLALLVHDVHHPDRSQVLYRQAEQAFMQAVRLGNVQVYYQLAGLYSLTGLSQQALLSLYKAQQCGVLPTVDDLMDDPWLDNMRHMPEYQQFIHEISTQQS